MNFLLHSIFWNHWFSQLATKPQCTGLCHRNVKVASTGSAKMEDDSWFGLASLHQHSCAKELAVKQPPAPPCWESAAWRGAGPSHDSSACHLNGVLGSTEYPKSWLAATNSSSTKNERWCGYAMLLASVSETYEEDRGVQQSPAWGIHLLLGWSHSTCICTINQHIAQTLTEGVLTAILKSGHFRNFWNKLEEEFYLVVFSKGISPWLQNTAFHKGNEYEVFSCPLATFSVSALSCNSCI